MDCNWTVASMLDKMFVARTYQSLIRDLMRIPGFLGRSRAEPHLGLARQKSIAICLTRQQNLTFLLSPSIRALECREFNPSLGRSEHETIVSPEKRKLDLNAKVL